MTATTTTINAAITYLVTTATNAWAADQSMTVFDGPTPAGYKLESQNRIWIGADPTLTEPGAEAVTGTTGVATLSQGRSLNEDFAIVCAIEHWDGGTDFAEARAAAFGYLAVFQQFLRGLPPVGPGDTSMGGALGPSGWAQATISAVHQLQLDTGADVVIVFHVLCRARLTT
jgi:hypothetical protein